MTQRMAKLDRILMLVSELTRTSEGLTLDEMAERVDVSRRTVERMRDIILLHFDLEEVQDERQKRFLIRDSLRRVYTRPTAAEVAALQAEVDGHRAAGRMVRAEPLGVLLSKVRGALDDREKRRLDPDLDALARLQRTLPQAGPDAPVAPETLVAIQTAIMAGQCVEFEYLPVGQTQPGWRRVIPYGLVHGALSYLICNIAKDEGKPFYYRLDRMTDVRVSDLMGSPPHDWDLDTWLEPNFGVYQEAPQEVRLRVKPHAVERARGWRFHASQVIEQSEDGGLVVRFRAGGMQELVDHLFSWAGMLVIDEPPALQAMMAERLASAQSMISD
ncbi:WYL domain-containing transcriptional regulator [Novosphingobium sp. RD2P27]|uniref:WYL domain-containing transcriptional regulator n=1 Tax=Novosphingobium kalidii TaxID=3230299 RepID=A0ABV2D0Z3_9SPHN